VFAAHPGEFGGDSPPVVQRVGGPDGESAKQAQKSVLLCAAGGRGGVASGGVKFLILGLATLGGLSVASLESQRRAVRLSRGMLPGLAVTATAACTLILIRLPLLHGNGRSLRFLLLAPLVVSIAWMWPRARPVAGRGMLGLYGAYVAMLAVAVLRPGRGLTDAAMFAIVATFATLLLSSAQDEAERRQRLIAVALAPGVYVLANMLLHLAGVQPPGTGTVSNAAHTPSSLLSLIGVSALRTQFPMGTGINAFGVIAAVGLAGSTIVAWQSRGPPRLLAATCVVGCVYCSAYSDTRTAVFGAVAVLATFALFRRLKAVRLLAVVVPLSPFAVTALVTALASAGVGGYLSRTGNDFSTGTNRFYIWKGALKVLHHFQVEQVIGWGKSGQIPSGASLNYAYIFRNEPDPAVVPAHNFMIQTVLDTGYLGLALTVVLIALTITRLEQARRAEPGSPVSAILAMMLVVVISGLTEALPTTTVGQEALVVTLFAMAFAVQPDMLPSRAREPVAVRAATVPRAGATAGVTLTPWRGSC
jgi:hypothetical protein